MNRNTAMRNVDKGRWTPQPGFLPLLVHSRLGHRLLAGVPAILATGGVLVLAGAAALTEPGGIRARYYREASLFLESRNHRAALLGFERVAALDGPNGVDRRVEYDLAVCLNALGQDTRAKTLMDRLAPDDGAGFAPAHAWKAARLLAGANRSPAAIRDAESHLLHALQDAPNTIEAHNNLGEFYLATGWPERAIPYLEKLVVARPELLLTLARVLQARGDRFPARERAAVARKLFQKRAEDNPSDFGSRLRWVEAAVFLEDFPSAVSALEPEAGLRRDDGYARALSQVYTAWADAVGREPGSDLTRRVALLQQGLDLDPSNEALIGRFARLIRAGGEEGARAGEALRALVASGRATGPVLFALGLEAWLAGRRSEACLHWGEASRLDPGSPVIANNLACALAAGPDPDLTRALAIINPVIALRPDEPRFRETRGQILARLERWQEALPDLKAALAVYPDRADLHRALAETYVHLNAPSMAAEHRRRADATPGTSH
jgi:tetratricopeptide (TPR) repeat protein